MCYPEGEASYSEEELGYKGFRQIDDRSRRYTGTLNVKSTDGYHYAVLFVDSYSRYAEVYVMQSKDQTLAKFQQFVADVGKTATIVTDSALEYNSMALNNTSGSKRFDTRSPRHTCRTTTGRLSLFGARWWA